MKTNASDVLVETLIDWEVEVVFGLPGDGINGMMRGEPNSNKIIETVIGDRIRELV